MIGGRDVLTWISFTLGVVVVVLEATRWWTLRGASTASEGASSFDAMSILNGPVPVLLLALGLVLSWRWPAVGAVAFLGYFLTFMAGMLVQAFPALGITLFALLFKAPVALVGLLFLSGWLAARHRTPLTPSP